jgi:hypothetical protein
MRAGGVGPVGHHRHRGHVRSRGRAARNRRRGDGRRRTAAGRHRRRADDAPARGAARPVAPGGARRGRGGRFPDGVLHLDARGRGRGRNRRVHRIGAARIGAGRAGHRSPPPDRPLDVRRRPRPGRNRRAVRGTDGGAAFRPRVGVAHRAWRWPGSCRGDDLRDLLMGCAPPHRARGDRPRGDGVGLRAGRAAAPAGAGGHRGAAGSVLGQRRRRRLHGDHSHVYRLLAVRLGAGARLRQHGHDPLPARAWRRRHPRGDGRR